MNVRLLEPAQLELDEAISYYNEQVPGLGDAFLLEAVVAIDRIQRFPDAWHPLGDYVRRCRLRRFPYGLIYGDSYPDQHKSGPIWVGITKNIAWSSDRD